MKVAIIGAGQVGTSVALGAHHSNFAKEIVLYDNYDSRPENAGQPSRLAELNDVINENNAAQVIRGTGNFENLKQELRDADIVILATPLDEFGSITRKIARSLKSGAILTDVGSLKTSAVAAIKAALRQARRNDVYYWWSHPGKGTEGQGPRAAEALMYKDASVFVGSLGIRASAEEKRMYNILLALWQEQDAQVMVLDHRTHDRFFGITSHLEHVIAFALMEMGNVDGQLRPEYAAAGTALRNTTRVATASPAMWLPVFKGNKIVINESAGHLRQHMESILAFVEASDVKGLEQLLRKAHNYRASLANKDATNAPPIFRENIFGEIADLTGIIDRMEPENAVSALANSGKTNAFASGTGLPFLVGVAATLNAEQSLARKIDLTRYANTSFLDGSAPALNDPAYMARLLVASKADIVEPARTFLQTVDTIVERIVADDRNYIENLINTAHARRELMPMSRRFTEETDKNAAVRPEYLSDASQHPGEQPAAVAGGRPQERIPAAPSVA